MEEAIYPGEAAWDETSRTGQICEEGHGIVAGTYHGITVRTRLRAIALQHIGYLRGISSECMQKSEPSTKNRSLRNGLTTEASVSLANVLILQDDDVAACW